MLHGVKCNLYVFIREYNYVLLRFHQTYIDMWCYHNYFKIWDVLSRSHIDLNVGITGNNVEDLVTTKFINHLLFASSIAEWSNQIQHESHNVLYIIWGNFNFSSS